MFGAASAGQTPAPTFSFGGPPAKAPAPAFGGFGAATTSTAAPTFGGFGTATTSTATPAFGGFGTATTSTAAPTLGGFGVATTSTATSAFGGFGATTSTAAPTLGGFGTTAATTSATGFGGFGSSTPAAASTTPAFGGFGSTTTTTTAGAAPTLNFGAAPATTSAAAAPTPGFGAAAATTSSGFSFGAASTAVSAPSVGLGGTTTAPALSLGLGGGAQGAGTQSGAGHQTQDTGKVGKESVVPKELGETVEELRTFVKEEKDVSSEVSHLSDKQFKRIKEDAEALSQLVSVLATGVQQSKGRLDRLKLESGQELVNAEIAVRTRDTPASMQYENTAPTEYFVRLITQFEAQMQSYRKQIEQTEQHLQVLGSGNSITSEDIVAAVQKLHAALTDLAARYQTLHTAVAAEKATYGQLHRGVHGCTAQHVFESRPVVEKKQEAPLPSLAGPSPFTAPTDPLVQARNSLLNRTQPGPPTLGLGSVPPTGTFGSLGAANTTFGANPAPAFGANNTFGGGTTSGFGNTTSGFGGTNTGFGGGFVAPNSTFGAGNTSSVFGASSQANTFGSPGFGATSTFGSSTFGASTPTMGTKRNKH